MSGLGLVRLFGFRHGEVGLLGCDSSGSFLELWLLRTDQIVGLVKCEILSLDCGLGSDVDVVFMLSYVVHVVGSDGGFTLGGMLSSLSFISFLFQECFFFLMLFPMMLCGGYCSSVRCW